MQIVIETDESVPWFAQPWVGSEVSDLVEQIRRAVVGGELKPGDALPSIRQLANDLDLDNETVAKAYRLLERDSVIQTKGYRGAFVHPEPQTNIA